MAGHTFELRISRELLLSSIREVGERMALAEAHEELSHPRSEQPHASTLICLREAHKIRKGIYHDLIVMAMRGVLVPVVCDSIAEFSTSLDATVKGLDNEVVTELSLFSHQELLSRVILTSMLSQSRSTATKRLPSFRRVSVTK
jgi:hypothetical protein